MAGTVNSKIPFLSARYSPCSLALRFFPLSRPPFFSSRSPSPPRLSRPDYTRPRNGRETRGGICIFKLTRVCLQLSRLGGAALLLLGSAILCGNARVDRRAPSPPRTHHHLVAVLSSARTGATAA